MQLIKNPRPLNEFDQIFNAHVIANEWRAGKFGVAFDIYDELRRRHLFRSYSLDDAEPIGDWERRNEFTPAVDTIWARVDTVRCETISYVPTAQATQRRPTSMQNICDILRANYRIALQGEREQPLTAFRNQNNRIALHAAEHEKGRSWFTRWAYDDVNRFLFRVVIARASVESFDFPVNLPEVG